MFGLSVKNVSDVNGKGSLSKRTMLVMFMKNKQQANRNFNTTKKLQGVSSYSSAVELLFFMLTS